MAYCQALRTRFLAARLTVRPEEKDSDSHLAMF